MPLTKTDKIWMNGRLVPWDQANIHILSHVVHYGTCIFEGIRCYETPRGPAVFRLQDHIRRMVDGCRIYRQRPPQCLSYPFWFQNLRRPENWQVLKRSCPGVGRGSWNSKSRILAIMDGSPPLGTNDTLCHFTP